VAEADDIPLPPERARQATPLGFRGDYLKKEPKPGKDLLITSSVGPTSVITG
jgi:hypothetical protein